MSLFCYILQECILESSTWQCNKILYYLWWGFLLFITVFFRPFTHFLHTYWGICTDFLQAKFDPRSYDGGQGHIIMVFFSNTNVKQLIYMLHFKFFFNTRELQLTYMIYGNCLSIGTVLKERKNISAGFNQIWLKTGLFFFMENICSIYGIWNISFQLHLLIYLRRSTFKIWKI